MLFGREGSGWIILHVYDSGRVNVVGCSFAYIASKVYTDYMVLLQFCFIGLRHCLDLNYGNNATSAASFIIVNMTRAKRVL